MRAFQRILDRIVDFAMIVAEVAITLMMIHITVEITIRLWFRYGLDAVPEIVAYYYMAGMVFLSLAYVTRADAHISAQIFTQNMRPRAREILEGCIAIALCLFMLLLTWQTALEAATMTRVGELHQAATLLLPKWPPRWYLPVGSTIMAAYAFLLGIQKLLGESSVETGSKPSPATLD